MAVNNPFFTKRETTSFATRSTGNVGGMGGPSTAPATTTAAAPLDAATTPLKGAVPDAAGGGSKLTVGPNIKLKGVEITDCDTLVVEGTVEATMDSRLMQIAEQGAFHGAAEIDIAEIRGEFVGNLTVRQKLVIYSTGKVSGKIRYGKIVMEEGGCLSGEVEVGVGAGMAAGLAAHDRKLPAATSSSTAAATVVSTSAALAVA